MLDNLTSKVFSAIKESKKGIITLDLLNSLRLCSKDTLKTILSRLNKAKKILRLKRGIYAIVPLTDSFASAQAMYNGYLGFTTALYLHKLISEIPFNIFVVTTDVSKSKKIGEYLFKAVALKNKAIGFETKDDYVISTKAKTLFDCILLPNYSLEEDKLINTFKEVRLTKKEWKEFDFYVHRFTNKKTKSKFLEMRKRIIGEKK